MKAQLRLAGGRRKLGRNGFRSDIECVDPICRPARPRNTASRDCDPTPSRLGPQRHHIIFYSSKVRRRHLLRLSVNSHRSSGPRARAPLVRRTPVREGDVSKSHALFPGSRNERAQPLIAFVAFLLPGFLHCCRASAAVAQHGCTACRASPVASRKCHQMPWS